MSLWVLRDLRDTLQYRLRDTLQYLLRDTLQYLLRDTLQYLHVAIVQVVVYYVVVCYFCFGYEHAAQAAFLYYVLWQYNAG